MSELSKKIAKDIFECGYETGSPTTRIEFKALGHDGEIPQGGLCEEVLEQLIANSITEYFATLGAMMALIDVNVDDKE